jgi:endoribonuclease Nob1
MIHILDASVFFSDYPAGPSSCTTPSVVAELVDLRSKCRFEVLSAEGLSIREPEPSALTEVRQMSAKSGDLPVLSQTDFDLLAVAVETGGVIVTDDFALQNVARHLGIQTKPILQRPARKRTWKFRCCGCGRYSDREGECQVCGAPVKRTLK